MWQFGSTIISRSAARKECAIKYNTHVLNHLTHTTLGDTPTTEDLYSITSRILGASSGVHLKQPYRAMKALSSVSASVPSTMQRTQPSSLLAPGSSAEPDIVRRDSGISRCLTNHFGHLVGDVLQIALHAFGTSNHSGQLAADNWLTAQRLTERLALADPSVIVVRILV